jgi:hypothetical protein
MALSLPADVVRNLRIALLRAERTPLLLMRAFSFVPIRLICDLIFAICSNTYLFIIQIYLKSDLNLGKLRGARVSAEPEGVQTERNQPFS